VEQKEVEESYTKTIKAVKSLSDTVIETNRSIRRNQWLAVSVVIVVILVAGGLGTYKIRSSMAERERLVNEYNTNVEMEIKDFGEWVSQMGDDVERLNAEIMEIIKEVERQEAIKQKLKAEIVQ